ncbi:DUF4902 domain-containing protein [Undibacterium arcticum]|uniref:DUF4902 domain-containing protein n=1 Tax=Undibacterium arcticum TaxID=1762892 RepID=A0ABV7F6B2_9BURK
MAVSSDGYIRFFFPEIQNISIGHLISGIDQDAPLEISDGAHPTSITGYTEWVNQDVSNAGITIGWDWQMSAIGGLTELSRISGPRSNVMLQSSNGKDVGYEQTSELLGAYIDNVNWQTIVLSHIVECY